MYRDDAFGLCVLAGGKQLISFSWGLLLRFSACPRHSVPDGGRYIARPRKTISLLLLVSAVLGLPGGRREKFLCRTCRLTFATRGIRLEGLRESLQRVSTTQRSQRLVLPELPLGLGTVAILHLHLRPVPCCYTPADIRSVVFAQCWAPVAVLLPGFLRDLHPARCSVGTHSIAMSDGTENAI